MSQLNLEDNPNSQLAAEINAISNHQILAIVSLLFCCPAGLIALYYSVQTSNAKSALDYEKALSNSSTAQIWAIISIVLGVLSIIGRLMAR